MLLEAGSAIGQAALDRRVHVAATSSCRCGLRSAGHGPGGGCPRWCRPPRGSRAAAAHREAPLDVAPHGGVVTPTMLLRKIEVGGGDDYGHRGEDAVRALETR